MTHLIDKLRYDFDWWGKIGDVIFWDCGNPIYRDSECGSVPIIRRKKGTNGTYEI